VLTHGPRGASVYRAGEVRDFPTRRAKEVDLTGAGDVFAAAFLIRLAEVDDPWEAARFANVVASFSVEGQGVSAIPSRSRLRHLGPAGQWIVSLLGIAGQFSPRSAQSPPRFWGFLSDFSGLCGKKQASDTRWGDHHQVD